MKLKKFKEHSSLVVLTTEEFYQFINNDNRKTIDKQIEFNFRTDDQFTISHQIHYCEIYMRDYKKRHAILKTLVTLLSPLIDYLNQNVQDYIFHDSLGGANSDPSNPNVIINRYHIKACRNDGNYMSKIDIEIIQNEMMGIFDESNRLISEINKKGEDEKILSLFLTKIKENRINPIIFKNIGASYIVYELFNFKKSTSEFPLSYDIGLEKPITLISPETKYHEALLDKIQYVLLEEITQTGRHNEKLLSAKGVYVDNKIITSDCFEETVDCKDENKSVNEIESIYNLLINKTANVKLVLAIQPSQSYICHEGINAKKYKIVGVHEIN